MIKHKKCDCDDVYWEEIVVQNDENYNNKNVIYFHCQDCDTDFRVEDFEIGEEVFYNDCNYKIKLDELIFQSLN